ncbi:MULTISPECIES: MobQ family relaxase [Hydrocarboniphaga]|uniref:MobQ family relaxase n=1 Tax=Hydrocarboniphaga TaxID=243627 RepID=UPI0012FA48A9|nr:MULTISPECIES: MobQ family relaxase [Hydrocarboniphaga]MDZ4077666.1 MobQ family relaxase [Hydrocarboniphaga sp.]
MTPTAEAKDFPLLFRSAKWMAIYRCEVKTFSRSAGHSAVAKAAYRARDNLLDESTGLRYDYSKRPGLAHSEILLPKNSPAWAKDQSTLWNQVEKAEKRKNSTVAREFLIALPHELSPEQRIELCRDLGSKLVERFGFALQFNIHLPDKPGGLNHHVHMLASTRMLEAEGFTDKTRDLDEIAKAKDEDGKRFNPAILEVRKLVADITNEHLAHAGFSARVDHRSLLDQQQAAADAGDLKALVHANRQPTIKEGHGAGSEHRKAVNVQIRAENFQQQREFIDLLKAEINPIEIKKEALAMLGLSAEPSKAKPSGPIATSSPHARFEQFGNLVAHLAGQQNPSVGSSGGSSMDGSIEATISQIDALEAKLAALPGAFNPKVSQQRASLKKQIENLKAQLAQQLDQKTKQKGGGSTGPTFPSRPAAAPVATGPPVPAMSLPPPTPMKPRGW